jgi:hypothetical protein
VSESRQAESQAPALFFALRFRWSDVHESAVTPDLHAIDDFAASEHVERASHPRQALMAPRAFTGNPFWRG